MQNNKLPNPKPTFYAVLLETLREKALELGYILAIHGSMLNDFDIVACAWRDDARQEKELVDVLWNLISEYGFGYCKEELLKRYIKPGGRINYVFPISEGYYIDLTIYPPRKDVK